MKLRKLMDDRRSHHLNHHALFGGSYRSGAVGIMRRLIGKYGRGGSENIKI